MNRTELYQLCTRAGIVVSPATSSEDLIAYLTGERDPPPMTNQTHPIDRWRLGLIGMLLDYWESVQAQLKCPARYLRNTNEALRNPRPCFGCLNAQVLTCVVKNASNEQTIRLYLPIVEGNK